MMQQETNKTNTTTQTPDSQQKRSEYLSTIREGAIAANVFCGQAQDGREYHYFSLSRSWKNTQGEQGYSSKFFGKNAAALAKVIAEAETKCKELDKTKEN